VSGTGECRLSGIELATGQAVALVGASGSGKSTFLLLLAGLLELDGAQSRTTAAMAQSLRRR